MIAYIPARGGSKRIPRKNIKPLAGKPIIAHVIETLRALPFIDRVCVSTEDAEIADVVRNAGAETLAMRDPALSTDHVMFLDLVRDDVPRFFELSQDKNNFLFVLATAALIPQSAYEESYRLFQSSKPEVLMSMNRFNPNPSLAMTRGPDGLLTSVFPDQIAMRTQDMPPYYLDAGCFYFIQRDALIRCNNFFEAKCAGHELSTDVAIDVDSESDWARLEERIKTLQK